MRLKRKLHVVEISLCLQTIDLISTLPRKRLKIEEALLSSIDDHAHAKFYVVVDQLYEFTYQRNKKKR